MKKQNKGISLRSSKKGTNPAMFIYALITIVFGLALLPTVRAFTNSSKDGSNTDGLLDLIPLAWVIAVVAATLVLAVIGVKGGHHR